MRLHHKLAVLLLAVTCVAVVGVGLTLTQVGEGALRRELASQQRVTADLIAAQVTSSIQDLLDRIERVVSAHAAPSTLGATERQALARLVYQQWPALSLVSLVDAEGRDLIDPVYLAEPTRVPALAEHPAFAASAVPRFKGRLPLGLVSAERPLAISAAYSDGAAPRVALVLRLEREVLLAAELEIGAQTLPTLAAVAVPEHTRWSLLDARGLVLWTQRAEPEQELAPLALGAVHPLAAHLEAAGHAADQLWHGRYLLAGQTVLATIAPCSELRWQVVVEAPAAAVMAVAAQMRRQAIAWLIAAALAALVLALLTAWRLKRRLAGYLDGVARFGRGELGHRVPELPADELGALGGALNRMASDLATSRAEIEAFNRELQQRVDAATAELRGAYAQLITQGRLVAVGQLGAGMAHELNNPLSAVIGNLQLLRRRKGAEDPEQVYLKRADEAAQRCVAIVSGLLRFSQRQSLGRVPDLQLNELVTQVAGAFHGEAERRQVRLDLQLDPAAPPLPADPGELSQVLLQLLGNACNAMPDGGTITIATRPLGQQVELSVRDTGPGIPAELLERIFDPFFTTKDNWRGVGLGLSIVYRIVADHGGSIQATSHPAGGALLIVKLPLVAPATPDAPTPARGVTSGVGIGDHRPGGAGR